MKISFDFDGCLANNEVQLLAKKFIDNGDDVYITTARFAESNFKPVGWKKWWNMDLFKVADKLNISRDKIRFTNHLSKYLFLEDFDIHFDDDKIEIEFILENLKKCVGVLIKNDL